MTNSALVNTLYARASVCRLVCWSVGPFGKFLFPCSNRSTCATLNYISAKGAVWTKEVMAKVDAFMENQVDASKCSEQRTETDGQRDL